MGPSGSGISTLLQLLGGLDKLTSGQINVGGQDLSRLNDSGLSRYRNHTIGFIFQSFNLQSHLTSLENVALPLILGGVSSRAATEEVSGYLDRVHLMDKIDKYPAQLSGGEMQRVAIARALVRQPTIILADEPTANLDKENAENVQLMLLEIDLHNQAIIVVTHDDRIAARFEQLVWWEWVIWG